MENLDLNSIGVQEMNVLEMKEADGGWFWPLVFGYIILEAFLNPDQHKNAFNEGWARYDEMMNSN